MELVGRENRIGGDMGPDQCREIGGSLHPSLGRTGVQCRAIPWAQANGDPIRRRLSDWYGRDMDRLGSTWRQHRANGHQRQCGLREPMACRQLDESALLVPLESHGESRQPGSRPGGHET